MLPDDLVILPPSRRIDIGTRDRKSRRQVRLAAPGADLDDAPLSLVGSQAMIGHLPVEPFPLPVAAKAGVVRIAFRGGLR